jgi:hypothetical protein
MSNVRQLGGISMRSPAHSKWPRAILIVLVVAYAAVTSLAITAWVGSRGACPVVQAGNCDGEKFANVVLSWFSALGAALIAATMAAVAPKIPRFKTPIELAAMVLAAPPAFFVLKGLAMVLDLLSKITYSH